MLQTLETFVGDLNMFRTSVSHRRLTVSEFWNSFAYGLLSLQATFLVNRVLQKFILN